MRKYAKTKDIVEFGLNKIPEEQTITMNLRDFMYIFRSLEEYMRFFHQPLHYQTLEDVQEFLGTVRSNDGFRVLSTAVYQKLYKVELPEEIEKMIDEDVFDHPLFPKYYRVKRRKSIDKTKLYIDRLVNELEVPLINSLIFPNGDLLVFEHTILGEREKHILNVLCKSTIESYFEYNAFDSVSSCDATISTENEDFVVYAGEGSWGGEGIIYVISKKDNQLVWFFFSDRSNPFKSVEIKDDEIVAISTYEECWKIPIHSPEKMKIEKVEENKSANDE